MVAKRLNNRLNIFIVPYFFHAFITNKIKRAHMFIIHWGIFILNKPTNIVPYIGFEATHHIHTMNTETTHPLVSIHPSKKHR